MNKHAAATCRPPIALVTLIAAAALASSCATQPFGDKQGEPVFQSFRACMIANGMGAVLLGALVKDLTGSTNVGVAAAAITLFAAWKACGQAHQRVTVSDERGRDAVVVDPRFRAAQNPVLVLDALEVTAPKAGEDITTRYRFSYASPDASRKDIPAKEKFIFLAGFVNDKGAQEFKEIEFNRSFVIQQGRRSHAHAVPSDQSFGQFKPWKLRYVLEVDGRCTETEAAFVVGSASPGKAGPAKPCVSAPQTTAAVDTVSTGAKATPAPTAPTVAPTTAQPAAAAEATLRRALRLQLEPGGAWTGKSLAQGTKLQTLETRTVPVGDQRTAWVRVRSTAGDTGWTLEANLKR